MHLYVHIGSNADPRTTWTDDDIMCSMPRSPQPAEPLLPILRGRQGFRRSLGQERIQLRLFGEASHLPGPMRHRKCVRPRSIRRLGPGADRTLGSVEETNMNGNGRGLAFCEGPRKNSHRKPQSTRSHKHGTVPGTHRRAACPVSRSWTNGHTLDTYRVCTVSERLGCRPACLHQSAPMGFLEIPLVTRSNFSPRPSNQPPGLHSLGLSAVHSVIPVLRASYILSLLPPAFVLWANPVCDPPNTPQSEEWTFALFNNPPSPSRKSPSCREGLREQHTTDFIHCC